MYSRLEPSKRIVSVIVKVCAVKKIQQCTHITLERCKNNPKSTFRTRGEGDEGICETQGEGLTKSSSYNSTVYLIS